MVEDNNVPLMTRRVIAAFGVIIVVWGLLGIAQMSRWANGGFDTNSDGTVGRVEPGGPADRAGLEENDLIVAAGETADTGWWKKPPAGPVEIGGTQILHVERNGVTAEIPVVWEPVSPEVKRAGVVEFVVTLAFLGFGLWAFFVTGNRAGLLLALLGLAYGFANFRAPVFASTSGPIAFTQSQLSLLCTALLAHFLMTFPQPKWLARDRLSVVPLYLPFAVSLASSVVAGLVYPAFRGGYVVVLTVTDVFYMTLALAALVHGGFRLIRRRVRGSGFVWIAAGLGVAIGPFVILALIRAAVPEFAFAGEDFMPLFGIGIPAGLALAVVRGARNRVLIA